jgi:hypothetical protein
MHLFEAPELESMTPFGWANPESIRPLVEMVQRSLLPRRRGQARRVFRAASQDVHDSGK